jgi:hypothetical protein
MKTLSEESPDELNDKARREKSADAYPSSPRFLCFGRRW